MYRQLQAVFFVVDEGYWVCTLKIFIGSVCYLICEIKNIKTIDGEFSNFYL